MTKRNNIREFKFNEKWKDGRLWLLVEDGNMFCSYCKELDKKAEKNDPKAAEKLKIVTCDSKAVRRVSGDKFV